jgi:hypothetical protein
MLAVGIPPLLSLAQRAARGKRRRPEVARFLLDLDRSLAALFVDLDARAYTPQRGQTFLVRDPKTRLVYALPFRDRVVQHLLIDATLPTLERSWAPQSYACRTGKGNHRALRRATDLMRVFPWVLRVDIRKFFPTIDLLFLRRRLDRSTPADLRWLRDRFLVPSPGVEPVTFHFPGDDLFSPHERPHGLPIGSLTSQIWANEFLSPLDHLLACKLALGTFIRYCDDLLIFDRDAGKLREALATFGEHATAMRLRLHPTKTRLHRTTDPVPCLGFVLRRHGDRVQVRLKHDNLERMRQRIDLQMALFQAGAIEQEEVLASLRAWLAHARHGHTQGLIRRELERFALQVGQEDR